MKARILIIAGFFFALAIGYGQTVDNTIRVSQFPGNDVGTKVANAMKTCTVVTQVPCILVIEPSLATMNAGTMPTLCSHCYLEDWRNGPPAGGAPSAAHTLFKTYTSTSTYGGPAALQYPAGLASAANGILVSGTSIAWGDGLPFHGKDYPDLLAKLLNTSLDARGGAWTGSNSCDVIADRLGANGSSGGILTTDWWRPVSIYENLINDAEGYPATLPANRVAMRQCEAAGLILDSALPIQTSWTFSSPISTTSTWVNGNDITFTTAGLGTFPEAYTDVGATYLVSGATTNSALNGATVTVDVAASPDHGAVRVTDFSVIGECGAVDCVDDAAETMTLTPNRWTETGAWLSDSTTLPVVTYRYTNTLGACDSIDQPVGSNGIFALLYPFYVAGGGTFQVTVNGGSPLVDDLTGSATLSELPNANAPRFWTGTASGYAAIFHTTPNTTPTVRICSTGAGKVGILLITSPGAGGLNSAPVYLAGVSAEQGGAGEPQTGIYNDWGGELASNLKADGWPVTFINLRDCMNTTDDFAGSSVPPLHPGPAGQMAIALCMAQAIGVEPLPPNALFNIFNGGGSPVTIEPDQLPAYVDSDGALVTVLDANDDLGGLGPGHHNDLLYVFNSSATTPTGLHTSTAAPGSYLNLGPSCSAIYYYLPTVQLVQIGQQLCPIAPSGAGGITNCLTTSCIGGSTYTNGVSYTNLGTGGIWEVVTVTGPGGGGTGVDWNGEATVGTAHVADAGMANAANGSNSMTFFVPSGITFSVALTSTGGAASVTKWFEIRP